MFKIFITGSQKKSVVCERVLICDGTFFFNSFHAQRRRGHIRHFKKSGHASRHRGFRFRVNTCLVGKTRFPKMNLVINQSREYQFAARINHFTSGRNCEAGANRFNPSLANQQVIMRSFSLVDKSAPCNE